MNRIIFILFISLFFYNCEKKYDNLPFTHYYENGNISLSGRYYDEKPHGTWKDYYNNGQIKEIKTWNMGVADGEYAYYYENGQVRNTGYHSVEGSFYWQYSLEYSYNRNGDLLEIKIWGKGKIVNSEYYGPGKELLKRSGYNP